MRPEKASLLSDLQERPDTWDDWVREYTRKWIEMDLTDIHMTIAMRHFTPEDLTQAKIAGDADAETCKG